MKRLLNTGYSFAFPLIVIPAILFFAAANCANATSQADNAQSGAPAASPQQTKAKALVKEADAAQEKAKFKAAIAKYKKAIELDPANEAAHSGFIGANFSVAYSASAAKPKKNAKKLTKEEQEAQKKEAKEKLDAALAKVTTQLLVTYDKWIQENPRTAMYLWGKGEVYSYGEKDSDADAQFLKAIAVDPNCAPAYGSLSSDEAAAGDVAKQQEYAEKALAIDPNGASGTFFNYALIFLSTNPAKFRQVVEERVQKYPDGLEGLLDLVAENAESQQDRQAILDQILKTYGPDSKDPSPYLDDVMAELFNIYAANDSAKALSLAEKMENNAVKMKEKDKKEEKTTKKAETKDFWTSVMDYQKGLDASRQLLSQKKYAEAKALLEKVALHPKDEFDSLNDIDQTPGTLAMAEALAASGDAAKAYDTVRKALLPKPNATLEAELVSYGAKLGKSPNDVEQDVWQARESSAKPMKPFDLKEYVTGQDVKLSNFRGHVTLVNFWFPG